MINLSIKSKVLLVALSPVLITAIVLSMIFIKERITDTERFIHEKGNALAQHIAPEAEYGIISGNRDYLLSLAANTLLYPDVVAVTITDNKNNVLIEKRKTGYSSAALHAENNDLDSIIFNANIYQEEVNVNDINDENIENIHGRNDRRVLGEVFIEVSKQQAIERQHKIINNGLLVTCVALLLTIFIALYFSQSVTKPITLLTRGIRRIRDGHLGYRINAGSGGEIAILENGINNMSAALEIAQLKEKQRTENELFIEKTKAQITLEAIGEGVISTDIDGRITYINPAAENMIGLRLSEATGKHLHDIFLIKSFTNKQTVNYPLEACLQDGKPMQHDMPLVLTAKAGAEFVIRDMATPIISQAGEIIGTVLVFHDFTHIQRISDQLSYQASHDELTGLFNRREFVKQLNKILAEIEDDCTHHALCYLDLDQFKIVNDTCGHAAGDALLKQLTQTVKSKIRKHDILARLGGDEFGIILVDCPFEKALELSNNIKQAISGYQCTWDQHCFDIGVSIGVVPITSAELNLSELMMKADTACYIAKDKGRNRVHVYQATDGDSQQRSGEMLWLQRLNKSLDANNFELFCQSITPLDKNNADTSPCHEILLRMKDEDGSLILPGHFLPTAERYSLMPKIDRWVFHEFISMIEAPSFKQAFSGQRQIFNINLSGQSLCDDGFLEYIMSILEDSAVDPNLLTFEITETAAISNFEHALRFITLFKEMGCGFALDDFGSGLSSFRYLQKLPVDYLKIDGSFIKNIKNNPLNRAIVNSITQISQTIGLQSIAEFVESNEILDELIQCKVDYVQGYAIEMPQPLDKVLYRLSQRQLGD